MKDESSSEKKESKQPIRTVNNFNSGLNDLPVAIEDLPVYKEYLKDWRRRQATLLAIRAEYLRGGSLK